MTRARQSLPAFAASDFHVVSFAVVDCLGHAIDRVANTSPHLDQWRRAGYRLVLVQP